MKIIETTSWTSRSQILGIFLKKICAVPIPITRVASLNISFGNGKKGKSHFKGSPLYTCE